MKKRLVAALIGLGAGIGLLALYVGLQRAGVVLRPELVMVGTTALAFAGTVAVFSLVVMDRPAFRRTHAALMLNEEPAKEYVYYFSSRHSDSIQISARPDMSVGEMLVRYGDEFKAPPSTMTKSIVVTLKGSARRPFASTTLQQLFSVLKLYNLEHVILKDDRDGFVGYIPGKRAAREFSTDKAPEAIDKYIVKVLVDPAQCGVLHDIGGATRDDTIAENQTALQAQNQIWANEKVQGLVLHKGLKPVGYISKVDILRINAGLI